MMDRVAAITLVGVLGLSGLALAATLPMQQDSEAPAAATGTSREEADLTAISGASWTDATLTAGDWFYEAESAETLATFGASTFEPLLMLRCDLATGRVGLAVASESSEAARLHIRTETQSREVSAAPLERRQMLLVTEFAAADDLLDAIAFSRGRFAVERGGGENLYVPAWPEITRVIEDCR